MVGWLDFGLGELLAIPLSTYSRAAGPEFDKWRWKILLLNLYF
jgi:hypothetical protein